MESLTVSEAAEGSESSAVPSIATSGRTAQVSEGSAVDEPDVRIPEGDSSGKIAPADEPALVEDDRRAKVKEMKGMSEDPQGDIRGVDNAAGGSDGDADGQKRRMSKKERKKAKQVCRLAQRHPL